MSKMMMIAMASFAAGIYVGYQREEELEDFCRSSRKTKKKAMRKMHKAYDDVCGCMNTD